MINLIKKTNFNAQAGSFHIIGLVVVFLVLFIAIYITKNPVKVLSQTTTDTKPPATLVYFVNPITSNIFTCNAQVNITCADEVGGSGCNSTSPKYCIDQTDSCTPNQTASIGPLLVSQEGLAYIRYQSTDNVGN